METESFQKASNDCHLALITQYDCALKQRGPALSTTDRIICRPVDRVFRLCKDRAAVEITEMVDLDAVGASQVHRARE